MGMLEQVQADLTVAMKSQEKVRLASLRMLKSALKNAQIDAGTLDDAAAMAVIMKLCKQRKESIEVFEKNNRQELADIEKAELAVLEEYFLRGSRMRNWDPLSMRSLPSSAPPTPRNRGLWLERL